MLKKTLLYSFLLSIIFCFQSVAQELKMETGKAYILSFDEEIQNFHTNSENLDVQILHTIFNDKLQMLLYLKNKNDSFLQVKTEKNLYNYEIKHSSVASKELTEVDFPPIENLSVDIFEVD